VFGLLRFSERLNRPNRCPCKWRKSKKEIDKHDAKQLLNVLEEEGSACQNVWRMQNLHETIKSKNLPLGHEVESVSLSLLTLLNKKENDFSVKTKPDEAHDEVQCCLGTAFVFLFIGLFVAAFYYNVKYDLSSPVAAGEPQTKIHATPSLEHRKQESVRISKMIRMVEDIQSRLNECMSDNERVRRDCAMYCGLSRDPSERIDTKQEKKEKTCHPVFEGDNVLCECAEIISFGNSNVGTVGTFETQDPKKCMPKEILITSPGADYYGHKEFRCNCS
jgi:hypothetical protein